MGRKRKPEPTADPEVDAYVEALDERLRDVVTALRRLLRRILADELTEGVYSGLPVYESVHGKVCYVRASRIHVQIGFWHGVELPDPDGLLRGTGERMRHVRLRKVEEVDTKPLRALLRAAARFVPAE